MKDLQTVNVHFRIEGDPSVHMLKFYKDLVDLGETHVKHLINNLLKTPIDKITLLDPEPQEAAMVRKMGCSNCGSTEPHHVAYVGEHGVCVS